MKFDIMTLFPEFVDNILNESIIGRARKSNIIDVECHNIKFHRSLRDQLNIPSIGRTKIPSLIETLIMNSSTTGIITSPFSVVIT